MSTRFQLCTQTEMIVDLAIKGNHVSPRWRNHGLMTGRRKIKDGKATMRQCDTSTILYPYTGIIRPTMVNAISHFHCGRLRSVGRKITGLPESG